MTLDTVDNDWWLAQANAVDRDEARKSLGFAPQEKIILFCAKLQPWKRPMDLLHAFASAAIPNAKLVFAGDGAQRAELENEAAPRKISDKVQFLGFVNQSQLPSSLQIRRPDGHSLVATNPSASSSTRQCCAAARSSPATASAPFATSSLTPKPATSIRAASPTSSHLVANCAQRPNPPRIHSPESPAKNQHVDSPSQRRRSCRSRRASDLSLRKASSGRASLFGKILVKLLIYSHFFAPSVGGVETIVALLARKLADTSNASTSAENFQVTVATQTPASAFDDRTLPFPVVRAPSLFQLWRLIRSADVVHIAGPSLAPMFLAKLARTPYVVEHHGYQAICPNGVLIHQPDRSNLSRSFSGRTLRSLPSLSAARDVVACAQSRNCSRCFRATR